MTEKTLTKADLAQFTGTEQWHRNHITGNILYTDGVQHVAEAGGAYWLIYEIVFAQSIAEVAQEPFQTWKLQVHGDHTANLICEDGNSGRVFSKRIEFTDFPLAEIEIFFTDNVMLLPSEY